MQPLEPSRHAIHLGAAWEAPGPHADGGTVWRRRFGRPTGLEPADRLLLVVVDGGVDARIVVNGVWLPPLPAGAGRWEEDVTPLLRDRNELELVLAAPSPAGSLAGPHRWHLPAQVGRLTLEIVVASVSAGREAAHPGTDAARASDAARRGRNA